MLGLRADFRKISGQTLANAVKLYTSEAPVQARTDDMLRGHQQIVLQHTSSTIMGTCLGSKRIRPQRQRPGKRLQLQTVAVGWVSAACTPLPLAFSLVIVAPLRGIPPC